MHESTHPLDASPCALPGYILPTSIAAPSDWDESQGTLIVLPIDHKSIGDSLRKTKRIEVDESFRKRVARDLQPELLLFLHKLDTVELLDEESNQTRHLHRRMLANGHVVRLEERVDESAPKTQDWLLVKDTLKSPKGLRSGVRTTEMAIALPINLREPTKSLNAQDVFAFLPLCSYGFKFVIQADWIVPAARESIDASSAW
jgi:hypothetical protein